MFKLTGIAVILFITTALNLAAALVAWRRRKTRTGFYFALGIAALTFWTLAAGLGYAAVPLELKILFAKLDAAGYHSALVLFLLCALHFAGFGERADRKMFRVVLFGLPALSVLLIATNELHGWVWRGFTPVGNNVVVFEHGPGFVFVAVTGYLLIIPIIGIMAWLSRNGSDIQRRQARLMLYASAFSLLANTVYQFGVEGYEGVDWSSVTFSVTGLLFLLALKFARFVDIIPIARDQLVSSLGDGMIVVDTQNRIIDMNPAAERIFGGQSAVLVGTELKSIEPLTNALLEKSRGRELRTEFETGAADKQYYDALISPLLEKKRKTLIGHLIILRNVTDRKENELRLQQLSRAVEQSPTSVIITDTNGIITFVNPFFTMLTGYAPSEALGKNPNIVQSGQTPEEVYRAMWQTLLAGRMWDGELLNKKKNGELYWVHAVMTPVVDSGGRIQSFIAVQEDITSRKLTEQALENRFLEVQALNKELQEAQSQIVEQERSLAVLEERQRLGRDLHDSVNQSIHSLMLFSETLVSLLENGETGQAIRAAQRIHESGEQALREVRLLVYGSQSLLMRSLEDLISAFEQRLDMVERRAGIDAKLEWEEGFMEQCPLEWAENLYWIVLEALNNSLKHSQAQKVEVFLQWSGNRLKAQVKDDGAGFDPGQAGGGGFGMKSMRERAESLGGELSVNSSLGHGTSVEFAAETA